MQRRTRPQRTAGPPQQARASVSTENHNLDAGELESRALFRGTTRDAMLEHLAWRRFDAHPLCVLRLLLLHCRSLSGFLRRHWAFVFWDGGSSFIAVMSKSSGSMLGT